MLSVYGGTNFYIGKRMYRWLSIVFHNMNWILFTAVYLLLIFTVFLGFMPIPSGLRRTINWVSAHWMGVYVYLLMLILLADIVMLLGRLTRVIPAPLPQSVHFFAGVIIILMTTGIISYGKYNAGRFSDISYTIETNKKEPSAGIKIVLVSDLHLGAVNSEKRLPALVQGINKQEPDIVCIAGDIFNDDITSLRNPSEAIRLLKSIKAAYGVYACFGNHDGGKTINEMFSFLEQSGIKLLNDEYAVIDEKLVIIGRLDSSPIGGFGGLKRKDISGITALIDKNLPIVVMDHNPSNIGQYGDEIDLILSGHTHRGQIFPANLVTRAIYTVDYGHYRKTAGSPHVIVTSGAGTWSMPMRIGTNNEIVSILMRGKQ